MGQMAEVLFVSRKKPFWGYTWQGSISLLDGFMHIEELAFLFLSKLFSLEGVLYGFPKVFWG